MAFKIILITNDTEYLPRSLILIHKIVSYTGLSNATIYNGKNTSHLLTIFSASQKAQKIKLAPIELVNGFKQCLKPARLSSNSTKGKTKTGAQTRQAFHVYKGFQQIFSRFFPKSPAPFSVDFSGFSIDSRPRLPKGGLTPAITAPQGIL